MHLLPIGVSAALISLKFSTQYKALRQNKADISQSLWASRQA